MLIGRELESHGITTPAGTGATLGVPVAEATTLLRDHQWREGNVARLEVAAARLEGRCQGYQRRPGGAALRADCWLVFEC